MSSIESKEGKESTVEDIIDDRTPIYADKEYRPHRLDGPILEDSYGNKAYAVHGVFVPEWIIMEKHKINNETIDAEKNIEIRRVMLDLYGLDNYIRNGKYEVLDEDTDQFGRTRRLLQKDNGQDEPIVRVEVVNSSPELDGAFKTYLLAVDFELRPLFPNIESKDLDEEIKKHSRYSRRELIEAGKLGDKQEMTCHNAVASSFGLYGHQYGLDSQVRQGDVLVSFNDGSNRNKFRES